MIAAGGVLRIDASAEGDLAAEAVATSVAVSIFGIAGAGARAASNATTTVQAFADGSVSAGYGIAVNAEAQSGASARTLGAAGGTALAVGVSEANSTNAPLVEARLAGGATTTYGDVIVAAKVDDLSNKANARAVAVAAVGAGSDTRANAITGPIVRGRIEPGAIVRSGNNVVVTADSTSASEARSDGFVAAGIVGVGVTTANAAVGSGAVNGASTRPAETSASLGSGANISAARDLVVNAGSAQAVWADTKGKQYALVAVGTGSATALRNAPVSVVVGADAKLNAGRDIVLDSTNRRGFGANFPGSVAATATHGSGGLIAAGMPKAFATVNDSSTAQLGDRVQVDTGRGSFKLRAVSQDSGIISSATSFSGGLAGVPEALAVTSANDPARAVIGAGAVVNAGLNVLVESVSGLGSEASAKADGKGLGSGADATAEIFGTASSRTDIGAGARMNAGLDMQILAYGAGLNGAIADSEVSGGGLGVDNTARSTIQQAYLADVVVAPGSRLDAPGKLELRADSGVPSQGGFFDYSSFNRARAVSNSGGFAGKTNAFATSNVSGAARVDVQPGTTKTAMRTSNLVVAANAGRHANAAEAERPGFVLINGGSSQRNANRPIDEGWANLDADVTITGGGAYLYIDAAGNEVARRGVTYMRAGNVIYVDPITNFGGGQASVTAKGRDGGTYGDSDFRFDAGRGAVTLINDSAGQMFVDAINALGDATAKLTVSPAHAGSGAYRTSLTNSGGSLVSIFGAEMVNLTGRINNPYGLTSVVAANGDLRSFGNQMISSQEVVLAGDRVGQAGNRIGVELIQGTKKPTFRSVADQGDNYLALSARNLQNSDAPLVEAAAISGGRVDVTIGDSGLTSSFAFQVATTELSIDAGVFQPIDVSVASTGDLPIDRVWSRVGNISLTAGGAIRATRPGGETDLLGNSVSLVAAGGIGAATALEMVSAYSGPTCGDGRGGRPDSARSDRAFHVGQSDRFHRGRYRSQDDGRIARRPRREWTGEQHRSR